MKEIIKEYYSKAKIMPNLLDSKIEKFEKNECEDIHSRIEKNISDYLG